MIDDVEFENIPYAGWLEETVRHLVRLKPKSIGVSAVLPDGNVMTGYYDADATQIAVMAHNFQMDAIMDSIINNIDMLKDAMGIATDDDSAEEGE